MYSRLIFLPPHIFLKDDGDLNIASVIGFALTLRLRSEGKQLKNLPRKVLKIMGMRSVPQTDTGRQGE